MCTQEAEIPEENGNKKKENHLIAWSLIDRKFYLRKSLMAFSGRGK